MASRDPLGRLVSQGRKVGSTAPAKAAQRFARRDVRLPRCGDTLSRTYKGREITVRVLKSGFEYDGQRFRSLSAIAKFVTGAHWNGLLFFGIIRQER